MACYATMSDIKRWFRSSSVSCVISKCLKQKVGNKNLRDNFLDPTLKT